MPISIMQGQVEVGIFNILATAKRFKKNLLRILRPLFSCCEFFYFTFLLLILFVCRDIHLNPMLKRIRCFYNFSICHWSLNSITTHNHEKINLLKSYNTGKKFGLICISEWYLDWSISSDSEQLSIGGYKSSL